MAHSTARSFRDLHQPGNPFILANAWDQGSAKMLAAMGAEAIGSSSAAHAFTLGRPDMGHVTRDEALSHAQDLVAATPLPVSGDFENGFGDAPETVAETVRLSAEVGLAGISIEDTALPSDGAYAFDFAVDRIKAAAAAARSSAKDFVLVARADGVMNGQYNTAEAIRRVIAFADAGADCVYVPVPPTMADIAKICGSVSVPVNALAVGRYTQYSRADFANAGVARISVGSALARTTHNIIQDAGDAMINGDFSKLKSAKNIDAMLIKGSRQSD